MSLTLKNSNTGTTVSINPFTMAVSSPTVGSVIFFYVENDLASGVTFTVTDNSGLNTWTQLAYQSGIFGQSRTAALYATVNNASSAFTISANNSNGVSNGAVAFAQYTGQGSPFFDAASAWNDNGGSTNNLTSNSIITNFTLEQLLWIGRTQLTLGLSSVSSGWSIDINAAQQFFSIVDGKPPLANSLGTFNVTLHSSQSNQIGGWIVGVRLPGSSLPVYSVPDCRNYGHFPNASRSVNSTNIYDAQTSNNAAVPGVDSRTVKPVASGTYPQNSRTPGTFGPGE